MGYYFAKPRSTHVEFHFALPQIVHKLIELSLSVYVDSLRYIIVLDNIYELLHYILHANSRTVDHAENTGIGVENGLILDVECIL